ncbi:MAG: hypothetical protein NTV21_03740 [Planctomycetota bacterium]|nr:hypothetical protein [Planctomycetota bacterium]
MRTDSRAQLTTEYRTLFSGSLASSPSGIWSDTYGLVSALPTRTSHSPGGMLRSWYASPPAGTRATIGATGQAIVGVASCAIGRLAGSGVGESGEAASCGSARHESTRASAQGIEGDSGGRA